MKLTAKTVTLMWPRNQRISELGAWLREQLSCHGQPLRWAITAVEPSSPEHAATLQIEAVLIE